AGMRSHPGVAAKFFAALGDAGVNIEMISTSEIRVSVVCRDTDLDTAVRAVHEAFDLAGGETAVVHSGSGRQYCCARTCPPWRRWARPAWSAGPVHSRRHLR